MSGRFTIHTGDVSKVARTLGAASFDAILCDPPYGLSFMGKAWDNGVPSAKAWRTLLRVLRPGAPILAFGGTRTYHRLVVAIEDAGAEIRDQIDWIYGSGFPKSLDVSKAIDAAAGAEREVVGRKGGRYEYGFTATSGSPMGTISPRPNAPLTMTRQGLVTAASTDDARRWEGWGTALKPAHEPICLARKPLDGTVAENALTHGVGGINVDGARVATDWSDRSESWKRSGHSAKPDDEKIAAPPGVGINCHESGRWPANVVFDEEAARVLDEQSDILHSHGGGSRGPTDVGFTRGVREYQPIANGDSGGASRFFYVAKASRFERDFGCDALQMRTVEEMVDREEGKPGTIHGRSGAGGRTGARNHHPTIKPISLTKYLATMILPPPRVDGQPRRILVPFSGVGSEMIGALRAGWDEVVGIELDPAYVAIAEARIARWLEVRPEIEPDELERRAAADPRQVDLFGKVGT